MEYGFIIQTLVNHINMVRNHFHEMLHELIGYALALAPGLPGCLGMPEIRIWILTSFSTVEYV